MRPACCNASVASSSLAPIAVVEVQLTEIRRLPHGRRGQRPFGIVRRMLQRGDAVDRHQEIVGVLGGAAVLGMHRVQQGFQPFLRRLQSQRGQGLQLLRHLRLGRLWRECLGQLGHVHLPPSRHGCVAPSRHGHLVPCRRGRVMPSRRGRVVPRCGRHRRADFRQQSQQEDGILQLVRGVVGGVQQRTEHRVVGPAAHRLEHLRHQPVGVMLETAGTFCMSRAGVLRTQRQHAIAHQAGQFEDQPGMVGGDAQQPAPFVAEMPAKLGADAVAQQRGRAVRDQAVGRRRAARSAGIARSRRRPARRTAGRRNAPPSRRPPRSPG